MKIKIQSEISKNYFLIDNHCKPIYGSVRSCAFPAGCFNVERITYKICKEKSQTC